MANVRYPSAMAISFGVDADAVSTLQPRDGRHVRLTVMGTVPGSGNARQCHCEEYEVLRLGEDTTETSSMGSSCS